MKTIRLIVVENGEGVLLVYFKSAKVNGMDSDRNSRIMKERNDENENGVLTDLPDFLISNLNKRNGSNSNTESI